MDTIIYYLKVFWALRPTSLVLLGVGVILFAVVLLYLYRVVKPKFLMKLFEVLKKYKTVLCALILVVFMGTIFAFCMELEMRYQSISIPHVPETIYYEQQVNLYDEAGCEDYFYDYDGNIIAAQNGSLMSNWIPCKAGDFITRNGVATNVVCYFDKDKNFIERYDSYGLSTLNVPNNSEIAYVRMAVQPSPDRRIVYGTTISDESIKADYCVMPELKITERNLVKDTAVIQSPDGKEWRITVDNNGNLSAEDVTGIIYPGQLPYDFPEYTITGSGTSEDEYLIALDDPIENGYNYIFVMTPSGDITWFKEVPYRARNFRKIQYPDGTIRYAYQQLDPEGACVASYYSDIVLMDEDFHVINDDIHPVPYQSITDDDHGCESHDYKILADDHFIFTSVTLSTVTNIPGMEGQEVQVVNAIVQEQKNGEVLMQWESIDHPELYTASVFNNDYENYTDTDSENYADYVHINAVAVDPENFDLLISCRSLGLIKLDRETGDILWVMGRGQNDILGAESEQIGLYQHDVRYLDDGSFTIFDNSGGIDQTSRVCRYWIDEKTKTLVDFEEFTTQYKSTSMGSAKLIDEETDTYLISYGGGISSFAFEERNFSTNTVNMQFKFDKGETIYRIFNGVEITPVKN